MPVSTLTSKGQTTIPKEVRDRLGLQPGDRLNFIVEADGSVTVSAAKRRAADLRGLLKHHAPRRPVSDRDMDAAVREGALARLDRARRRKS
ncbi:MAG: AbrB/MazE/SpoVT family DNA-binding domain-containing protein [Alphaproteobacteria bacterium]